MEFHLKLHSHVLGNTQQDPFFHFLQGRNESRKYSCLGFFYPNIGVFGRFVRFLQGRNNLQKFTWPREVFYSIFEGFGRDYNFLQRLLKLMLISLSSFSLHI